MDQYNASRQALSKRLDKVTNLLEELEKESASMTPDQQETFNARIKVLDDLVDMIIYHDRFVNDYVRTHPDTHNVDQLHNQIKIAQKYINRLGGDWSIVTWGKLADY
jgi:hypothetical protein